MTTFHRIWFGDKPIPPAYEDYWRAWQRQYPGHEFVTWRDADIDRLPRMRDRIRQLRVPSMRADLGSFEILHAHGGVYLDCDVMPWHRFRPEEMARELTVCNESDATEYCSLGFVASPPGHPVFDAMIEYLRDADIDEGNPHIATGPWLFGKFLAGHECRRLPSSAFYPYAAVEPLSVVRRRDLSGTLGIHVWGGSWLPGSAKQEKVMQMIARGDVAEPAVLLRGFEGDVEHADWARDVGLMIEAVRDIREKTLQIVPLLGYDFSVNAKDAPVFELAKVAHWLFARAPDTRVWQVGTSRERPDPLRAALVNDDPPALLIDSDTARVAALAADHAAHANARAVALAPAEGGMAWQEIWAAAGDVPPDVLVLHDGAGSAAVIADVLDRGHRPAVIHFDMVGMAPADLRMLLGRLGDDYATLEYGAHMAAYRFDLIMEYAGALYVENGIATVFSEGVKTLNGVEA
ncbi:MULTISPECIES: glycosyltransferase family 32 protein [Sphingomonas]|jgi:hypothetical protein|uniref:glycosyltransferase family 32 protein n=1 Tax=Sphingomonas TaxID=13687 RepID=UPI00082D041A|nr:MULTISPECIES: glycosyltransferase [Sphingomonas]MBY0300206.1 hypothetical protein [Sphingomonas ginsenosidimutans]